MSRIDLDLDVAIVGSGAGGGAVAKELAGLAAAGARIAVFEWGERFLDSHNARDEVEMATKYYFDAGTFQTASLDMTLAFAKAVGGSTTVYTGTSLKMPLRMYEKWGVPGLAATDLEPRYAKYVRENSVHFMREEELNENNRLFRDACRSLGWHAEQFPVNTKGCEGLGSCNLGCAAGAKQGTNRVQLPAAERQGVRLYSRCRVDRIEDDVLWVESLRGGTRPRRELDELPAGLLRVRARKIVVCGGAVNSPALLLRSGLGRVLPALGRYFTCQPALILVGEHPRPIENSRGHPKSFFLDSFAVEKKFFLETCMYFPVTLAKSLAGFGLDFDSLMSRFDRLQMILALAIDSAEYENRVGLDSSGNPKVFYRFSDSVIRALVDAIRTSTRIFFAAGAERVHAPAAGRFFLTRDEAGAIDEMIRVDRFKIGQIPIAAAHLMGGCRMGVDAKDSVTDVWGRVHGRPDLYVADASLFPAACEINPYLTVMALADRVAEAVKRDMGGKASC